MHLEDLLDKLSTNLVDNQEMADKIAAGFDSCCLMGESPEAGAAIETLLAALPEASPSNEPTEELTFNISSPEFS